jgi:hypothetical protein
MRGHCPPLPLRPPLPPRSFLDDAGYLVSTVSFRGPFVSSDEIRAGRAVFRADQDNPNLYCMRKDLHEALRADAVTEQASAGGGASLRTRLYPR